jgi:sec-independent protein translocase protein TatA
MRVRVPAAVGPADRQEVPVADLGWPELAIIALAVVLLFGWKRMPDMARSLGRSARIFKSEMDQMRTTPDVGEGGSRTAGADTERDTERDANHDARRDVGHDPDYITVHDAVHQADARVAAADAEVARLRAELLRRKHANGSH